MYPSRIKKPKIGDKVIFYDNGFCLSFIKEEEKEQSKLIRFEEYTIKTLIAGTGTTFTIFEEVCGQHDLGCFLLPNDILLRRNKLNKIYEKRI